MGAYNSSKGNKMGVEMQYERSPCCIQKRGMKCSMSEAHAAFRKGIERSMSEAHAAFKKRGWNAV